MTARPSNDQPPTLDQLVEGELIALSWRNAGTMTVLGPILLVAVYLGIEGRVTAQSLWIWLSVFSVFMVLRMVMMSMWIIRKPRGNRRLIWGWYFFATMFFAAGFWGSLAPVFLHQLEPPWQAFIITLAVGVAGGSVTAFSAHRLALILIPLAILMPLAVTCILSGEDSWPILGGLAVLFYFYLLRAGLEHHATQTEALRLRFERSEMVDKLSAALDAAEQANETKSLFLANMSHELRTPLNAIMGFSKMIELDILGAEKTNRQREYASLIHGSGRHLLDLINDLLDVSKAEAGKLELHEVELDLGDLIESCLEILWPAASNAKVRLDGPASDDSVKLYADDRKLRQILINLVSNAMKFTPEGGSVSISYSVRPQGGVTISVADNGRGMTQAQLERAMQPFVQVEQGYDASVPGTGLGLPLSRSLIELHDGRLEMRTAPGVGTTALVHLPAGRLLETKMMPTRAAV